MGVSAHLGRPSVCRRDANDKVPGEGVIIHKVDTTQTEPAKVVDPDNNGNPNDAGAIWTRGTPQDF